MMASIGSAGKAMARPWSCRGGGRRRPGRVAGVIGVAVGLAMAPAACTSAQPSSTAAAGGSRTVILPGMSCAWPDVLSAQTDNTAVSGADGGTRRRGARASRLRQPQRPRALPRGKRFRRLRGRGRTGHRSAPATQLEFYKPAQSTFNNAGLANVDTSYALAYLIRPPSADVVVVTAKAPTFAPGSRPLPWPARGEDVRYWSMCVGVGIRLVPLVANKLPGGGTDYGCRADEATRLNAAGDYTYVIGSESQRAAISRVPGVTFLPFSTTHPAGVYLLALRDVLVSSSFAYSPQGVTQADDPAAAAAVMGPYYPRTAVCPLATLTAHGPQACLR